MPYTYPTYADRLMANTVLTDGPLKTSCWIWHGSKKLNGYGKLNERRADGSIRTWLAHRWAVARVKGVRIRKGQVVMHLCNVPACCNPDHLSVGTQRSNVRQCVREGRHVSPKRATHRETVETRFDWGRVLQDGHTKENARRLTSRGR